ncbi:MAG: hypothetical protein NC177_13315 [Ruminococcus flavefaciens]|nr:hypothetical protein [Ruminococcus flavefaciens]
MNEENEKVYTLKSVQSEIAKLEKSRLKKKEKISNLTAELKVDNTKMKELEKIYDELYHEDLQQKIAKLWFKEEKMTKEQVEKFLELSINIHDKIDALDVQTIVNAVTYAYNKQRNEAENSVNVNTVNKIS